MYKIKEQIKVMALAVLCLAGVLVCNVTVWAASADNSLSSLTLSEGTLSPSFQYNVVNYNASVGSGTNSIEVQAKTSNERASIQSGVGTHELKEGNNTIKVVVQAENGNLATYTIQVTKDAGSANPGTDGSQGAENEADGAADVPGEEGGDTPAVVTGADGYTAADFIPESVIPADFTQTTVSYLEEERPALQYDKGDVTLLYMVNEENEGMLFLYDTSTVYPFIKLSAQDKYLILLPAPAEAALGINYTAAELAIDNKNVPSAYQNGTVAAPDFYQVYGINSDGAAGWYQYDSAEGTYQRYQVVEAVGEDETDSEEYEFLQKAYNELGDKYADLKSRDTKYMAGLVIAIAVLLVIIVNLLLFRREKGGIFGTGKSKEIFDEDVNEKKEKKEKKKKSKKERKTDSEGLFGGGSFYEKDDDSFADFDEEPEFGSGEKDIQEKKDRKEKKEKKRFGKKREVFDDGDDYFDEEMPLMGTSIEETPSLDEDLEILDLNDL